MKHFFQNLKENRTTHERRSLSLQIAGVCTAVLFVGWLATLGMRLTASNMQTASEDSGAAQLVASVSSGVSAVQTQLGSNSYYPASSTYPTY